MYDMVIKLTTKPKIELVHQMPYFLDTTPSCCVPSASPSAVQSPVSSPMKAPLLASPHSVPSSPVQEDEIQPEQIKFQTPQNISFGSALEKIYFGTAVPRAYFFLWVIGIRCFTGMSYVFRKSSLDLTGGLAQYGRYLAEDYFICRELCKIGSQTISAYPALQNVGSPSIVSLKDRLVRWMRLRVCTVPTISLYFEVTFKFYPYFFSSPIFINSLCKNAFPVAWLLVGRLSYNWAFSNLTSIWEHSFLFIHSFGSPLNLSCIKFWLDAVLHLVSALNIFLLGCSVNSLPSTSILKPMSTQ